MVFNHATSKVTACAGAFGMYHAFIDGVSVYKILLHDVLATTDALNIPIADEARKALLLDTEEEDGYVIGRSAILTKQNVTLAPDGVDDATTDTSDEDSFSRRLKTQPEECNDVL